MEMTFIKLCTPTLSDDSEALLRRISELEIAIKTGAIKTAPVAAVQPSVPEEKPQVTAPQTEERTYEEPKPTYEDTPPAPVQEEKPQAEAEEDGDEEKSIPWAEVLSELQKINAPLWGVLMDSQAVIRGDFVLIKSSNPTLNSFIRQPGCARNVKDSILRVTGKDYRLGIHNSQPAEKAAEAPKKDPLQNLISRARDMGVNVDVK